METIHYDNSNWHDEIVTKQENKSPVYIIVGVVVAVALLVIVVVSNTKKDNKETEDTPTKS